MIDLKTAPVMTTIKQAGQKYVDQPQFLEVKAKRIAQAVGKATGTWIPQDIKAFTHYNRTPLVWK